MQEIWRSFPVSAVSVPDSVASVSVLYRDPKNIVTTRSQNVIVRTAVSSDSRPFKWTIIIVFYILARFILKHHN